MKSVINFLRGKSHPQSFVNEVVYSGLLIAFWLVFVMGAVTPITLIGFLLAFLPTGGTLWVSYMDDERPSARSKNTMTWMTLIAMGEFVINHSMNVDYGWRSNYVGAGIVGMIIVTWITVIVHHRQHVNDIRSSVAAKLTTREVKQTVIQSAAPVKPQPAPVKQQQQPKQTQPQPAQLPQAAGPVTTKVQALNFLRQLPGSPSIVVISNAAKEASPVDTDQFLIDEVGFIDKQTQSGNGKPITWADVETAWKRRVKPLTAPEAEPKAVTPTPAKDNSLEGQIIEWLGKWGTDSKFGEQNVNRVRTQLRKLAEAKNTSEEEIFALAKKADKDSHWNEDYFFRSNQGAKSGFSIDLENWVNSQLAAEPALA